MKKIIILLGFVIIFSGCEKKAVSSETAFFETEKSDNDNTDEAFNFLITGIANDISNASADENYRDVYINQKEPESVITLKPDSQLDEETAQNFADTFNKYQYFGPRELSSKVCHELVMTYMDYKDMLNNFDIDWNEMAVYQAAKQATQFNYFNGFKTEISRENMIEYLVQMGYETEIAEYGADNYINSKYYSG